MSKLLLRSYERTNTQENETVSIHMQHNEGGGGAMKRVTYLLDFSFTGQNQILLRHYNRILRNDDSRLRDYIKSYESTHTQTSKHSLPTGFFVRAATSEHA
jgi:hypothetical protein